MLGDIRLQKNKFEPGHDLATNVAKLEQRLVLNSSWKFPPGFVAALPGQSGNRILTSRAYGDAQRMVDKAFANFAGSMAKVQNQFVAGKITAAQADNLIGLSGVNYTPNSLLGRLEASLRAAEAKIPYGRGVAVGPQTGTVLGVGLSDFSATGVNTASLAFAGSVPGGVPTYLRNEIGFAFASGAPTSEVRSLIEWTRQFSLRFNGTPAEPAWSWGSIGIASQPLGTLPGYVASFGSSPFFGGSRDFGTRNT